MKEIEDVHITTDGIRQSFKKQIGHAFYYNLYQHVVNGWGFDATMYLEEIELEIRR